MVIGLFLWSLSLGAMPVGISDLWSANEMDRLVIQRIRLPRSLAALVAGSALAISGFLFQETLRNPMASPYTLGISGASAFGAAIGIIFLPADWGSIGIWSCALAGSIVSVGFVFLLVRVRGNHPGVLVLGGIMLHALFSAATSGLQYFATDQKMAEILFWTFGDLGRCSLLDTMVMGVLVVFAFAASHHFRWSLALLAMGDDHAIAGGIRPNQLRNIILLVATTLAALVVAKMGVLAFVGLVAPHLTRTLIRHNSPWLLPASALAGGAFLLAASIASQHLFHPVVLPIGIVTSAFGAPLFLLLLFRRME